MTAIVQLSKPSAPPVFYRGMGAPYSHHAPHIDILLGDRLKARGFVGTRDSRKCVYAAVCLEHALEYTPDRDAPLLKSVRPLPGSVVTWVHGMRDMVISFENHLRRLAHDGVPGYNGVRFASLARDIQGDLDTAETYLRLGRQKKALSAMADSFLDRLDIREAAVDGNTDIEAVLDGHDGEIWINGPCEVMDFDPDAVYAPTAYVPTTPFA